MKLLAFSILIFFVVSANAESDDIDWSRVVPIEELPGFWDSRPLMKERLLKSSFGRNGRIVNGNVVAPHSIPFMVGLIMNFGGGNGAACGASLINARTTMTAAHCLPNSISTTVIAGAHQLNANEASQQRRTVQPSNYRIHANFQGNHRNDIALLIHTAMTLNSFVAAVVLPTAFPNDQFTGELATMSGWGLTGTNQPLATHLRSTAQPIISLAQCDQAWGQSLGAFTICTTSAGARGTCNGDSGGPVTVRRNGQTVQVGIISFIGNGCEGQIPNGHVRVTSFLNWIANNRA